MITNMDFSSWKNGTRMKNVPFRVQHFSVWQRKVLSTMVQSFCLFSGSFNVSNF